MGRIRTIKPEFFTHEGLADLEHETGLPVRLVFAGLWTQADREGRFEWRPRRLQIAILPYDDVDISRVLDALVTRGYLVRYACGTRELGCIPNFGKHQVVNNREASSTLPAPPDAPAIPESSARVADASTTRGSRDDHAWLTRHDPAQAEGEGERKRKPRKERSAVREGTTAGEKALKVLHPLLQPGVAEAKIRDVLGEDEALRVCVQRLGGVAKFSARYSADEDRASREFFREFGSALATVRQRRTQDGPAGGPS